MSTEITLSKLLEIKHLSYKHNSIRTLNDITFDILKEMFIANESRHLNPESVLFLHCKNSTGHLSNVVKRIFLLGEHIHEVISDETAAILTEMHTPPDSERDDNLMYMKEEIKQIIFRRTGQIHAHINAVDIEMSEIKSQIDDISNSQQSGEFVQSMGEKIAALEKTVFAQSRTIQNLDERMRDTVGSLIGSLIPTIIEDILVAEGPIMDIRMSIDKVTADVRSIKKTITGGGQRSKPQVQKHMVRTQQQEASEEDETFM